MQRLFHIIQSQIKYKIILPYLLLTLIIMLVGAGIAIYLVASSWQERFNNQLGQVARNFADTLAQREQGNIDFLSIIAHAPATEENIPAVADAIQNRNQQGLARALDSYYRAGALPDNSFNVVLDRLIAFDTQGRSLIHWEQGDPEDSADRIEHTGTDLSSLELVQNILDGETDDIGDKYAALITFQDSWSSEGTFTADEYYLFTVVPVRKTIAVDRDNPQAGTEEVVVGGLLIASRLDNLLETLEKQSQAEISVFYDITGLTLASTTLPKQGLDALNMPAALPQRLVDQVETVDAYLNCFNPTQRPAGWLPINPGQPACSILETVSVNQRDYQFLYAPLVIRDAQVGYFSVGLSRDYVTAPWTESRNVVFAITIALALGAIVLGYYIARQITRPLSDLVDTAAAVTHGQLERRSNVAENNEFGTLAQAFNQMTEYLLRLYTTSRDLNSTIEVHQVLDVATRAAASFRPGTEAAALLQDDDDWRYYARHATSDAVRSLHHVCLQPDESLFRMLEPQPEMRILHNDNTDDQALLQALKLDTVAHLQTVLVAPLFSRNHLTGLLMLCHTEAHAFSEADEQVLAVIANMSVTVLQNARLFMRVQKDATERQAILTSIGDAVVVCDNQGTIVLANPVAEEMLGIADWQTTRRKFADLPFEPLPAAREIFGQQSGLEHYRIYDRVVSRTNAPVNGGNQHQPGEVIVLHDITAEAAVDQAKTDFIATISHELRTPLTVIRGYIDLLLRGTGGELTADQSELLASVRSRANEMTSLVNNVIMIANIEAGTLSTELQSQDPVLMIEMVLAPLRSAFEAKGLELIVEEVPSDLPQVMADREQLKVMLTQLIDNSLRYTSSGSVTIKLSVSEEGMVQVDITDTGPGIAQEVQARLFARFQRIEGNSSAQRGGGLGLAITKQLAERQGGQVWIRSIPGQGSTFSLVLPQANEQNLDMAQQEQEAAAAS